MRLDPQVRGLLMEGTDEECYLAYCVVMTFIEKNRDSLKFHNSGELTDESLDGAVRNCAHYYGIATERGYRSAYENLSRIKIPYT